MRTECPDGVPMRDGKTYEQDRARVLDMLCLCGELDGIRANESYSSYLRRMIDALIEASNEVERMHKLARSGLSLGCAITDPVARSIFRKIAGNNGENAEPKR